MNRWMGPLVRNGRKDVPSIGLAKTVHTSAPQKKFTHSNPGKLGKTHTNTPAFREKAWCDQNFRLFLLLLSHLLRVLSPPHHHSDTYHTHTTQHSTRLLQRLFSTKETGTDILPSLLYRQNKHIINGVAHFDTL
jgi:hypothetical protein